MALASKRQSEVIKPVEILKTEHLLKEEAKRTTMYFPTSTLIALKKIAAERGSNVTELVINAVREKYNI